MLRLPALVTFGLAALAGAACGGGGDISPGGDTPPPGTRQRVMVETSGEGDGERASLVRLLLHATAFDVEGMVVTGAGGASVVRQVIGAYGMVEPRLLARDPGYPRAATLLSKVVDGTGAAAEAVMLVKERLAAADARPLWYLRWSAAAGPSVLRRALDLAQQELAPPDYRRLLGGLRVMGGGEDLGPHVDHLALEVDTTAGTATGAAALAAATPTSWQQALRNRGGALTNEYPIAATTEPSAFTYLPLLPESPGAEHEPRWQGWGGRFVPHPGGAAHRWVPAPDSAEVISRWASAIQNELLWRAEHARAEPGALNRAPQIAVTIDGANAEWVLVSPGLTVTLDARSSQDPDGHALTYQWLPDLPASTANTPLEIQGADGALLTVQIPERLPEGQDLHLLLGVTDGGTPPLTRYRRLIFTRPR